MKWFHVQFRVGSSNRKWQLLKVSVVSLFHLSGGFGCFLHGGDRLTIGKWCSFGRHMNKPTSIQEPILDTLSPTWNCWKAWILIQTEHAVIKVSWIKISTANLAIYNYILSICSLFQSLCPRFFFFNTWCNAQSWKPIPGADPFGRSRHQNANNEGLALCSRIQGGGSSVVKKILQDFCFRVKDELKHDIFMDDLFCFLI